MTSFIVALRLTFRELWARNTVLGLMVVATLALVVIAVIQATLDPEIVVSEAAEPGAEVRQLGPEQALLYFSSLVEIFVAGATYWIGILLGLFATVPLFIGFIESGRIDLLVSRPVGRTSVLAGHVLGVWAMMALLSAYLLGGVWVINSLATGVWDPAFLWSIALVVLMFVVMYAPALLVGLWTESTAVALIVSYGLIFASLLTAGGEALLEMLRGAFPALGTGLTVVYYLLPNFAQMTGVVAELARPDLPGFARVGEWDMPWAPLLSTLAFGAVVYLLVARSFARRDF